MTAKTAALEKDIKTAQTHQPEHSYLPFKSNFQPSPLPIQSGSQSDYSAPSVVPIVHQSPVQAGLAERKAGETSESGVSVHVYMYDLCVLK